MSMPDEYCLPSVGTCHMAAVVHCFCLHRPWACFWTAAGTELYSPWQQLPKSPPQAAIFRNCLQDWLRQSRYVASTGHATGQHLCSVTCLPTFNVVSLSAEAMHPPYSVQAFHVANVLLYVDNSLTQPALPSAGN